ncbi:7588_t:CDS:1, partial [Ambispora leptoticha]
MKVFTALALLMAAISLTTDAAPASKPSVVKLDLKKYEFPTYFTWLQKSQFSKNHALLKYSNNIRSAYSQGLVGQEAIVKLEAASTPVFGASSPKTFIINNKANSASDNSNDDPVGKDRKKKHGKNNNPDNSQPDNSSNQPDNTPKGVVEDPLTDEGFDIGYHGPVEIGGQTFDVIFDTGSADLWVPSQDCTDDACKAHKSYDPKKSKGFKTNNKPFEIKYGTGQVSGIIA